MSGSSSSGKQTRRRYSDQFKRDAVGLVTHQGYSLTEAARSLDVHVSVIRNWKEKSMDSKNEKQDTSLSESERTELQRLREENRKLRMEREILKKLRQEVRERGMIMR
ncbi:MAG: transposase [Planctomycetaceae bacterium]|jgi:transposase|nr:transposase [Planctomycetaceae bacterium]MDG2390462.1 transposase [Planctomycetaceae bacterium]